MRTFSSFTRLVVTPFEAAVALLLIVSGLAAMLHWGPPDPVTVLLPAWEAYLLSVMLILSGAGILAGIFLANVATEAFGLFLLCGALIVRLVLYGLYLGTDVTFALTGAIDAVFVMAAFTRLFTIRRYQIVIELRKGSPGDAPGIRGIAAGI